MRRPLIAAAMILVFLAGTGALNEARADNNRRGHNERHDNDRRNYHDSHDWNKGKHWENQRPPQKIFVQRYYAPPPRQTVVYYYPQPNYYGHTTYTETYYSAGGGYFRNYSVGGYLPKNRHWRPMNDYVRYGLPSPRRGERWVYADRDALLISEATSRIISGVVLAALID